MEKDQGASGIRTSDPKLTRRTDVATGLTQEEGCWKWLISL